MKKSVLVIVCLFSLQVFANDGGSAFINVKGIAPKGADNGTEIKFYGEDAGNFMRLLPAYDGVIFAELPKSVAAQVKHSERDVTLISKAWALSMSCRAGKLNVPQDYDMKKATYTTAMPECTIKLIKREITGTDDDSIEGLVGDGFSMEPKDYEKNMCK